MERQIRDEVGPFRGVVIQRSEHLEVDAIWDGDCLIDSDGADLAVCDDSDGEN